MKPPIILFAIPAALLLFGCSSKATFDSERWKQADLLTRERVEMVDPLLSEHRLKGMSRSAVIALLGEPTQTDKWEESDMIYVLGPTDYMPIDNEWLVIKIDKTGRVSDFKKIAD